MNAPTPVARPPLRVADLLERLDSLSSEELGDAMKEWFTTAERRGVSTKAARSALLMPRLADPVQVAHMLAAGPSGIGAAAALLVGVAGSEIDLALTLAGAGVEDAAGMVAWLRRGLLLVPLNAKGRRDQECLAKGVRAYELLPSVGGEPPVVPHRPGPPPAEVHDVVLGEATTLVSGLTVLSSLIRARSYKLRLDGNPPAALLQTVAKALGLHPPRNHFVWVVGWSTSLSVDGASRILVRPNVSQEPQALLRAAFASLRSDVPWADGFRGTDAETADLLARVDAFQLRRLSDLRAIAIGLLRRGPTGAWMAIPALVEATARLTPKRPDGRWSVWHTPDEPIAPAHIAAMFTRTFQMFGLVDVASSTAGGPQDLVRVTKLGRALLDGDEVAVAPGVQVSSASPASGTPSIVVTPDFEVHLHRARAEPGLVLRIGSYAEALDPQANSPVSRWKLTRERWIAALTAGADPAVIRGELEGALGGPLPANVATSIGVWTASYGVTTMYSGFDLLEHPSAAARSAVPPKRRGVPVGDRWSLVAPAADNGRVLDAATPTPRCLHISIEGAIEIDRELAPLHIERCLTEFATFDGTTWRLDRVRIARRSLDDVLLNFGPLTVGGLRAPARVLLRSWCTKMAPARHEIVELVQLVDEELASGIALRPDVAPWVRGRLAGGVLVLAPKGRRHVEAALTALGIPLESGLTVAPV